MIGEPQETSPGGWPRIPLTFLALRAANYMRCDASFHPVTQWSLTDWATALAGEVGKVCDTIKKVRRGDRSLADGRRDLATDLVDTLIYLDLLAARAGIQLDAAVVRRFNEISDRVNSPFKL